MADTTALVLCAHGTADPRGQQTVLDLADAVRQQRPTTTVAVAYVDVQEPSVDEVVESLVTQGFSVIVVPLLLSGGYHVQVDIARAVAPHPGRASATAALGPHPDLGELLLTRLREAGAAPDAGVVVAAAGSSRPDASRDVEEVTDVVRQGWAGPVVTGYGSAASPDVPTAVAQLREQGAREVAIAAYLLGQGHFHTRLEAAGADLVTAPLGADPVVVRRILDRAETPHPE